MKPSQLKVFAWGLSGLVCIVAVAAWGQSLRWHLSTISTYQLFPVFGLLAFSLMWSHYVAAVVRQYFKIEKAVLKTYFEATSIAVLAVILLHVGLLVYQLYHDGLGLPPGSELNYVPPSRSFYILIAMFSFFVFMSYELRRKFDTRSWWKYVQYASDLAIVLIYIHGLKLGDQLQAGWLRAVWYLYGLTLAVALGYIYTGKYQTHKAAKLK